MSTSNTVTVYDLLGRAVHDADGHSLGRVYDVVAEAEGQELRVRALLVGPGTWLSRFGWTRGRTGVEVPWDAIAELSPQIRLRRGLGQ